MRIVIMAIILLPMAGAFIARALGAKNETLRDRYTRVWTGAVLALCALLLTRVLRGGEIAFSLENVCGLGLTFRADGFRAVYATVAAFMWFMTTLLSGEYFARYHNRSRYYFFTLITLGATVGVFLSDDLYTAFVFFEIMSFASYPWVAHEETPDAMRAAATYLAVAVLGGMVTLLGLFSAYRELGSLSFAALRGATLTPTLTVSAVLILFGFAAKAGLFPMHIWLPKAHPVAPAPASALLSGMLTKVGMFGVLLISMNLFLSNRAYGDTLLILGLITMLTGAVLALFSVNLKRTLACSSMSQIGYIVTGVACAVLLNEEGALGAAGAVGHMLNHSLLKLTLFMAAGVVYMNAHSLNLNDIRGFGRGKWVLKTAFLLGALGLAGVPLLNGYASKTMIHEALMEVGAGAGFSAYTVAEWVFLLAAGLTTGYMLKLYIALFHKRNADADTQARYDNMNRTYLSPRSAFALLASAAFIPLIGVFPGLLLSFERVSAPFLNQRAVGNVAFFSMESLASGALTLIIGTLSYLIVVRKWMTDKKGIDLDRWPQKFDLENAVYRPVVCRFLPFIAIKICDALDGLADAVCRLGFIPGALFRCLDGLAESRPIVVWLPLAFKAAARVCNELTDRVALILREMFISTDADARGVRRDSVLLRVTLIVRETARRTKARIFRKDPNPTDIRYGSYATNAISFGLLLCAIGIVLAILYVFARINQI